MQDPMKYKRARKRVEDWRDLKQRSRKPRNRPRVKVSMTKEVANRIRAAAWFTGLYPADIVELLVLEALPTAQSLGYEIPPERPSKPQTLDEHLDSDLF